jgi:FkbM family methyltransferase
MMYLQTDKYIGTSLEVYGEYCESESEVFAQLLAPGQTVIEVGANIGAHTIHLSQLVGPAGRVFAFEPQRVVFQILCANVALNEAFNVRTFHAAAGAATGTVKVPEIDYYVPESNFGALSLEDSMEGEDIPILALDNMAFSSVRLLKIDVEGMEAQVIEGARQLIGLHRPVIYVENDRITHSAGLIKLIEELGYDMWWHFARLFNPNNHANVAENIFADTTSVNLLCLPKEETSSVIGFRKVTGPEDVWDKPPA